MVAAAAAMVIGYLKSINLPYNASGIESFIKSDGAGSNSTLMTRINNGKVLNMGFLARNLMEFVAENPDEGFQGSPTTGNICDF